MENTDLSFHKLFANFLNLSEYNLTTLSHATGIERTVLTKYRGGKNLPKNIEVVNTISEHLCLSNQEREMFIHAYNSDSKTKNFLVKNEMINFLNAVSAPISNNSQIFTYDSKINATYPLILKSTYEVVSFINYIITSQTDKTSTIQMYMPFEFTMAFNSIKILYSQSNTNPLIQHIIQLDNTKEKLSKNMFSISEMILFSFTLRGKYQPKYTYENTDISTNLPLILPYYIIVNDYLLLLSKDYNTAIIYNERSIIDYYMTKFNLHFSNLNSAISSFNTIKSITDKYNEFFSNSKFASVIEPLPCLLLVLDSELLRTKLRDSLEMSSIYIDYFNNIRLCVGENCVCYFTYDGLQNFVNYGKTNLYPDEFYYPFTIKERLITLKNIKSYLSLNSSPKFIMLKNSIISNNSGISVSIFEDNKVVFTNSYNSAMSLVNLNIPYLNQEFKQLIKKLPDSIYVYSNSEAILTIDNFINKLECIISDDKSEPFHSSFLDSQQTLPIS